MKILIALAALASLTAVPYRPHEKIALKHADHKLGRVKAFPHASPNVDWLIRQGGQ